MKHCHFSHFLYRAFHSPGFRLSTGLGFIVAVCQIVQMFSPVDTGFSYPSSLYEMWLGGEWASYASALVFLLLPLFATLPFSSSLAEDKKSGYLIQLLIRGKRLSVFFRYAVSAFLSGFVAAVLPFLENLFLNAAIYPALMPQPSTYTFSPSLRGFMVKIFYSEPLLYCLLYVLLIGIFFGALACFGLSLCFFIQSPVVVHLLVFAVYFWVYYLTMQLGWYSLNPYVFLNPTQAAVFQVPVYLIYVIGMLSISAVLIALGGKKYEHLT